MESEIPGSGAAALEFDRRHFRFSQPQYYWKGFNFCQQKPCLILQKERLIKDVRYQE